MQAVIIRIEETGGALAVGSQAIVGAIIELIFAAVAHVCSHTVTTKDRFQMTGMKLQENDVDRQTK